MRCPRQYGARPGDRGGIAVYTAIVTIALLGIVGLVLDGGGKLRATESADNIATEAARAAGQAVDPAAAITGSGVQVDPAAARAAADAFLRKAGVTGSVVSISADRTTITVTIHETYQTKFLTAVGITSLPVTGHGSATLLHGVDHPE
ncbi:TadE/TadG family type IV pilus assembly protein [Streptomyces sp. NPDC004031]